MNEKKQSFSLHIGSTSILLIFVLLCMISFATLSIVSANADKKLTQKIVERTNAYYDACNLAEKSLSSLDKTLISIYENSSSQEEYFDTVGHRKSYTLPISDVQNLEISLDILYPQNFGDTFYQITIWQVVNNNQ